jgi:hypothetical protein
MLLSHAVRGERSYFLVSDNPFSRVNIRQLAYRLGGNDPQEEARLARECLIRQIEHGNEDVAMNAMLALRQLGNRNGKPQAN